MTVDADEKFAAELAEFQPDLLGRMNDDFEDSVVFVARVLTGRSATTGARITSVDRRGVDVVTVGTEVDEQPARLDFDAPIDSPFELQAAMFGLITRARALSGEDGMTSAEREVAEMVADPHVPRRGRRRSPTCIHICGVSSCVATTSPRSRRPPRTRSCTCSCRRRVAAS